MEEIHSLKIRSIKIGKQYRTDLGDLEELAESIRQGLLQPIGVTPKRELVFGYRRLCACRDVLGWKTIPARIVNVSSILNGTLTENLMRKDFTVSERVAIYQAIKAEVGSRKGQRTDLKLRDNCPKVGPGERTDDFAAKRAGLSNRKTADRAEQVIKGGVPNLVAAMDSGEISVSAAAEIADLTHTDQKAFLDSHDQTRLTAQKVRKYQKLRRIEQEQEKERQAILQIPGQKRWTLTDAEQVVACDLLITDPPQGILPAVEWDNPPEGIEAFTRAWCQRWSKCGANYIAVFWNQRTKWEAKKWFDDSLPGYEFLQECCCHRSNYKKPEGVDGTHRRLRNSWEPVFLYRRKDCERGITQSNRGLGTDLTDDDHHSGSYPTVARNGESYQQHKCQKPVSAMRWLIHALSLPNEKVCDCFCGSGSSGIAALQLGRKYHGIETDPEHRKIAEARLSAFGKPDRQAASVETLRANAVVQGDCRGLIPLLPNRCVNLVLTSPIYAEQRKDHYASISRSVYPELTLQWMTALWNKLTDDGSVLIVIDPHVEDGEPIDYVRRTEDALCDFGWKQHQTQIWHRRDRGLFGHKEWPRHSYELILWFSKSTKPFCDPLACATPCQSPSVRKMRNSGWTTGDRRTKVDIVRVTDVIDVPIAVSETGIDHPTMIPIELAEQLIQTFCPPKGTVLDSFCGSGSTLLAAKKLDRTYYGFEIVEDYVRLARQRLINGNGKKARVG